MGGDNGILMLMKTKEIAGLRRELESISKFLTGLGNNDTSEDKKRAHHDHCEISGTGSNVSASMSAEDLQELSREQLIEYFKTVMNVMKIEHDYKIQEITEDYFSIRRRCLKLEERGAYNEFDMLRKKIPDIIQKLDKIDKSVFDEKRDAGLDSLLGSLTQADQKIQKLETDVEDSRFEASIYKDVYGFFLNQIQCAKEETESKVDLQDSWVESYMTQEYCSLIYKDALKEAGEKLEVLKMNVSEKEVALRSELEFLVKEKENDLATERDKLEIVFEQINNLQCQIDQQAEVIQDKNTQLKGYEMEISKLKKELELTRKNMKTTENEKVNCEMKLSSMVQSLGEWSKAFDNLECLVGQKTKKMNSRLRSMQRQLSHVSNEVDGLKVRKLMYKQQMDKKTCDLQKAETEVDLLGNEVDALLGLLEKIYIALDHYSPILKHYPGVIEILKLVRRELRGESKRYSVF